MENYSLFMGAAAVMKMAEMAAVSMEKPSGALPRINVGKEFIVSSNPEPPVPPIAWKEKKHWGPVQATRMSSRIPRDGKSVIEKAQDLKKEKNLEIPRGNKIFGFSNSFAALDNQLLLGRAKNAGISLGVKTKNADSVIDKIKEGEIKRLEDFHLSNPAAFLPKDISLSMEELRVGLEDENVMVDEQDDHLSDVPDENEPWTLVHSRKRDGFWDPEDMVSQEHNDMLNADFSEKEVKDAIFGSYAEGAPGPDGFSFLFYQHFWELIRADFMAMVKDWNEGNLDLINYCNSQFFLTSRGVRQGDPISPILFNFMADVFTKVLCKAAGDSQIAGLMQNLGGGIISMQYADDTLLFLENKLQTAINLKWILACFEHMSGMRINFHKCDLVPMNVDDDDAQLIAQSLSCKLGNFPMNYLGVPLHHSKLRKEDIQPVVDKILNRAGGWRGKLLSHAAKLELVKSVLASIPLYLLSVIKFPKWAITLINSQMAHCLWDNYEGHHKYHLANWGLVTRKKEFGGLGIPDLAEMNLCLLAS
ncbi:hypothetical protein QYE76_067797 [Lolium multiflorum]|uniref:Reverse transcriptase domain-containing protein n=1 Tax=Lolium multiflorum TaxID=4521 RepID=A0AAD8SF45_LOLMU|nr:hypothetical protein QYE76_067797 [Lolium multiflorum]